MEEVCKVYKTGNIPHVGYIGGACCNLCKTMIDGKFNHGKNDFDMCFKCKDSVVFKEIIDKMKENDIVYEVHGKGEASEQLRATLEMMVFKCKGHKYMRISHVKLDEKSNEYIFELADENESDSKPFEEEGKIGIFTKVKINELIAIAKIGENCIKYVENIGEMSIEKQIAMLQDPTDPHYPGQLLCEVNEECKEIENLPPIDKEQLEKLENGVDEMIKLVEKDENAAVLIMDKMDPHWMNENEKSKEEIEKSSKEFFKEKDKEKIKERLLSAAVQMFIVNTKRNFIEKKMGKEKLRKMAEEYLCNLEGARIVCEKDKYSLIMSKKLCEVSLMKFFNKVAFGDRFA